MSSVTPNIGLILPDGSENVSRQVINDNYTKIDTAFANVGNSTMREVPFNIPTSAWTLSSGVYTAEFTTAYVTASSKEIGTYTSSLRQYAKADIDMAKKSGGGGMVFTTTTIPTGTISGSLYIWDNDDGKVPIVVEGTVIPITNGGTGGNDLSTAKSNLGITAVENQTSANTQAIATLNSNLDTQAQTLSSFVIPITAKKSANVVVLSIEYTAAKEALTKNQSKLLGTLPEAYRPSGNVFTSCLLTSTNGDLVAYLRVTIEASGNITIYPSASIATSQSLFGSFAYCI